MPKEIEYTSREIEAISRADRVIVRTFVNGSWEEEFFYPQYKQTLVHCLELVQEMKKIHKKYQKSVIYMGNADEMAVVPRDYIPTIIKNCK